MRNKTVVRHQNQNPLIFSYDNILSAKEKRSFSKGLYSHHSDFYPIKLSVTPVRLGFIKPFWGRMKAEELSNILQLERKLIPDSPDTETLTGISQDRCKVLSMHRVYTTYSPQYTQHACILHSIHSMHDKGCLDLSDVNADSCLQVLDEIKFFFSRGPYF